MATLHQVLVVVLGHVNDERGNLSAVAKARCDMAAALIENELDVRVLPTGSFGEHFNTTTTPHHRLMARRLTEIGVPENLLAPGHESSGTIEDILVARRTAQKCGATEIALVTSDFHAERCQYIADRLLVDFEVSVHAARSPGDLLPRMQSEEARKLRKLQREWISPPSLEPGAAFPTEIYQEALSEQRHYDAISLASVAGAAAVAFQVSSQESEAVGIVGPQVFALAGSITVCFLYAVYYRAALTARSARRTARILEVAFDRRGVAANYDPTRIFRFKWPTIFGLVTTYFVAFATALALIALLL